MVKIKWDSAKHSLSLTRKNLFLCFCFSDISYIFFALFQPKIVHMYSFKPFMHIIQNNTILSRSNITYWKSGIFLVKVQTAWWNIRPLNLNEFQNFYKSNQGTAWINCKTNVSTERWNSRIEFQGKNDQPRKNLDKLTIHFFLSTISWAFRL